MDLRVQYQRAADRHSQQWLDPSPARGAPWHPSLPRDGKRRKQSIPSQSPRIPEKMEIGGPVLEEVFPIDCQPRTSTCRSRRCRTRIRDRRLQTIRTTGRSQRVLVESLYDLGFRPQAFSASASAVTFAVRPAPRNSRCWQIHHRVSSWPSSRGCRPHLAATTGPSCSAIATAALLHLLAPSSVSAQGRRARFPRTWRIRFGLGRRRPADTSVIVPGSQARIDASQRATDWTRAQASRCRRSWWTCRRRRLRSRRTRASASASGDYRLGAHMASRRRKRLAPTSCGRTAGRRASRGLTGAGRRGGGD